MGRSDGARKACGAPMNREELAWAAGLFDGEGYVGCNKHTKKKYRHLRINVGQTDTEVLCRFSDAVGLGRINGPTKARPGHFGKKEMWTLSINGYEEVQAAVAMLWRWLSGPKRRQATLALLDAREYYKTVRKHVRKRK